MLTTVNTKEYGNVSNPHLFILNGSTYIISLGFTKYKSETMISSLVRSTLYFDILSIYCYSVNKNLRYILEKYRFKDQSLTRIIEKGKAGEFPLFIRPVKREYSESDFFIDRLDTRKIFCWKLKEICSDGA